MKAEKVCNYWIQGNCSYGERCKFLHTWSVGDGFSLLTQLEGHQKVTKKKGFYWIIMLVYSIGFEATKCNGKVINLNQL